MSKIKAFVAAALISSPMLSLDAAQLQIPQNAPVMSESKPTTANGYCFWVNTSGGWFWVCIG